MEEIDDFLLVGAKEQEEPRTPKEDAEGMLNRPYELDGVIITPPSNSKDRVVTLTQIRVNDALSEGPIEGLVSGEYQYDGAVGDIGWTTATFKPFSDEMVNSENITWLRSVYWNEIPVLDKDGIRNFQQVEIAYTKGLPNGSTIEGSLNEFTRTRAINERLRGPDVIITNKGQTQLASEFEKYAKNYRILDRNVVGAIVNVRVGTFSSTVIEGEKAGDVRSTKVEYHILYKPIFFSAESNVLTSSNVGFNYKEAATEIIYGKTNYGYIRSTRINFTENFLSHKDFVGWEVRIFRVTEDSLRNSLRNQTFVDSITEVHGNKFNYPNTAIISSKFNAEYFSEVPNRAFDVRLLKIRIPNNYDPIKRTYDGIWDGEFAKDDAGNDALYWSDNPAWCFYDLITNKRYGLGKYIDENICDKWTLYEISQYCDQLVPDGYGKLEPRFTCNVLINSRNDAYKVINDMASIFRGLTYYAGGTIFTAQDSRKEPIMQFTNANVEDGEFTYSSSAKKTRNSVALVRYNDKYDFYRPAVEYVEDVDAIKKYGIREVEITAFGATSRGQALRLGRWALLTNRIENESVSFTAGLEAAYLKPGDIISIFDRNRHDERYAGRVFATNFSNVQEFTLDSQLSLYPTAVYFFTLLTPTYYYDVNKGADLTSSDISDIRRSQLQTAVIHGNSTSTVDNRTKIILSGTQLIDFQNYSKINNLVWTIEASGNQGITNQESQLEEFRVLSINETEENKFQVEALTYSDDKFTEIESGIKFELQDIVIPPPEPLTSIVLSEVTLDNNVKIIRYHLTYPPGPTETFIRGAYVYAKNGPWVPEDFSEAFGESIPAVTNDRRPNNQYLIAIVPYQVLEGDFFPAGDGIYNFKAFARNAQGVPSATCVNASLEAKGWNSLDAYELRALRLDSTDEAVNSTYGVRDPADEEPDLDIPNPSFTWDAGFNVSTEEHNLVPTIGVKFRITTRRSSSEFAVDRATGSLDPVLIGGSEFFDKTNPFCPSKIIYCEETGFVPSNSDTPVYNLTLDNQLNAYKTKKSTVIPSGIFREYDFVVEGHLIDGTSTAGGNFLNTITEDASYINPKGWDIIRVYNPKIRQLLTADITEATYTADKVVRVTLDPATYAEMISAGIVGGYIFTCKDEFDKEEAIKGKRNEGDIIEQSEFTSIQNPFVATITQIDHLDTASKVAIAFYDSTDQQIRTKCLDPTIDPYYDRIDIVNDKYQNPTNPESLYHGPYNKFVSTLNISELQNLTFDTNVAADGKVTSRCTIRLVTRSSAPHFFIDLFEWIGFGIADIDDAITIKDWTLTADPYICGNGLHNPPGGGHDGYVDVGIPTSISSHYCIIQVILDTSKYAPDFDTPARQRVFVDYHGIARQYIHRADAGTPIANLRPHWHFQSENSIRVLWLYVPLIIFDEPTQEAERVLTELELSVIENPLNRTHTILSRAGFP